MIGMKMNLKKRMIALSALAVLVFTGCTATVTESASLNDENLIKEEIQLQESAMEYYFPHEGEEHEGTWLQWPHDNTYEGTLEAYEHIWIAMTKALVKGENVHLIVYDEKAKARVQKVLVKEGVDMSKVDFFVFPTDDVWVRDNGPIFAFDKEDNLVIQNWQFNGWGNKTPYKNDNSIPEAVAEATELPLVNIDMVMEGGALETDGKGTMVSTLSCVNNDNRTSEFTLEEIEDYLTQYYGVMNFIWLDGVAGMDITDGHIDGMMKFLDENTIIADAEFDLNEEEMKEWKDAETLLSAKNADGRPYDFVFLPPTKHAVVEIDGEPMTGGYLNFYVGNEVVLVPNYDDPNDKAANEIIQSLYPDKEVVGIEVIDLFADGGMIHCVTQQQPASRR